MKKRDKQGKMERDNQQYCATREAIGKPVIEKHPKIYTWVR